MTAGGPTSGWTEFDESAVLSARDHSVVVRQYRWRHDQDPVRRLRRPCHRPLALERDRHRPRPDCPVARSGRSEEHTSELQSLMRISYAVFCLKTKNINISLNTQV